MNSVISKTIRSESPAPKEITKSNTITLKDSGKAKFNFIELKTCSSKKKTNTSNKNNIINKNDNINNNATTDKKENEDINIKINLFNTENQENEQENKKEPVYRYKKVKFNKESNIEKININNKYLNNSCKYN